jgi:hypothetical protein
VLIKRLVFKKKRIDKRGKTIQKGKLNNHVMIESNGRSQKKGCQCAFTIKMLYLLPTVLNICYYEKRYINLIGVLCHGNIL